MLQPGTRTPSGGDGRSLRKRKRGRLAEQASCRPGPGTHRAHSLLPHPPPHQALAATWLSGHGLPPRSTPKWPSSQDPGSGGRGDKSKITGGEEGAEGSRARPAAAWRSPVRPEAQAGVGVTPRPGPAGSWGSAGAGQEEERQPHSPSSPSRLRGAWRGHFYLLRKKAGHFLKHSR